MTTPNPMAGAAPSRTNSVSKKLVTIGGISTTVHGLDELPESLKNVACLWLLHPRLSDQQSMSSIANAMLTRWNGRLERKSIKAATLGLIAVSFDQRNHGSRQVEPFANEAWRGGNPKHAQDMFSIYQGTAADTSQLITYLAAYIFPNNEHTIWQHMTLGVSLGGHATWQCVLLDSRVSTGIVVIGCPDYLMLMSDRARLSKLKTWADTSPPGSAFLGSRDFPTGLVHAVEKFDPAGILLGPLAKRTELSYTQYPSEEDQQRLLPLMTKMLHGKRILSLSGGVDKLVPYAQSEKFLRWLKNATGTKGWFDNSDFILKDLVFENAGHEMTPSMVEEAIAFVVESLEVYESSFSGSVSKM